MSSTDLDDYNAVRAVVEIDVDQGVPNEHRGDARKEIEAIQDAAAAG